MNTLRPIEWKEAFRWKYPAYPFFTSVYLNAALPFDNRYYIQWDRFLNYFHDGQLEAYLPKGEMLTLGHSIIEELLAGKEDFVKEFEKVYSKINRAIIFCETAYSKFADPTLEGWWNDVQGTLSDVAGLLFSFDYALSDLMNKMQTENPEDFLLLKNFIREEKPSFLDEAKTRLRELTDKYGDNFNEVYDQFISEFGWFQNSYFGKYEITQEWLKNFIKEVKTQVKHQEESSQKQDAGRYSLLVKVASRAISFRDDKKKLLLIAVDLLDNWLREICRKNNWTYEVMRWLTVNEVLECLKGNKELFKKAEDYAKKNSRLGLLVEDGYEDVPLKLWTDVESLHTVGEIKEFKGMAASKGKVQGIAKIILDPNKDGEKFQAGNILVASMTRPEFLPLMGKAAAFITDEGGITCHAAIVAREMRKPCVIGTKVATQVLKDGDMVEVDAEKGIVKIIT